MYILNFNNLKTENIVNKIKINKYNNKPISFKGLIDHDTFEHTLTQPDKKQEEKQRIEEKVKAKKAEYNSDLSVINEEITTLKQAKQTAKNIAENEELSSSIESLLLNYLDAKELKGLISKKALEKGINSEKISEIIINCQNSYEDKYNKEQPTQEELLKDARRIIKANSEENLKNNSKKLIEEFCKNNSINIESEIVELYINCLLETKNQSNSDFINSISESFDKKIRNAEENKEIIENKINDINEETDLYFALLESNPDFAPFHEPLTSYSDKIQKLLESGKFKEPNCFEYYLLFRDLSEFGLLHFFEDTGLIYTEDEQNKKTLNILSGKEGKLKRQSEIQSQYHLTKDEFENLELPQIKFESKKKLGKWDKTEIVLYDLSNDETINKLEEEAKNAEKRRERTTLKRSKYAYGGCLTCPEIKNIPAKELERLGFGNVKLIRSFVQKGILSGSIQEVQRPEGKKYITTVNLHDSKTPDILEKLREKTPVIRISELSKQLGISQKNLLEMVVNDEVDIINEYLFPPENHTIYIDTRTEKNKSFIERKLFEKELAEQLKKQETERQKLEAKERKIKNLDVIRREQSLKMSIVWHFCPQTRDIASSMAVKDGYLCQLLVKESNEDEELTQKEKIKVNSYRRKMWSKAGTDELKEGYKKANEILSIYYQKGIDGIEDEEIRKIIEQYENN